MFSIAKSPRVTALHQNPGFHLKIKLVSSSYGSRGKTENIYLESSNTRLQAKGSKFLLFQSNSQGFLGGSVSPFQMLIKSCLKKDAHRFWEGVKNFLFQYLKVQLLQGRLFKDPLSSSRALLKQAKGRQLLFWLHGYSQKRSKAIKVGSVKSNAQQAV